MKLVNYNVDKLRRSAPAKMGKRFACCVIDMVIIMFVAMGLFSLIFSITENTSSYKDATNTVKSEIKYYEDFTKESHIVEYIDGKRVSQDVIVLQNVSRAIYLSYSVFGNEQQPNFTFDENHDVARNGIATLETDNVAYFYTQYASSNPNIVDMDNVDSVDYLFNKYKEAFGNDAQFIFTFNKSISSVPVLNTQVAYYLFHFLFVDESDTIGQTGRTYYDAYSKAYMYMLEEAENKLIYSEPYYTTHYLNYCKAYSNQARYINIGLVLSIIIASFIVLLISKFVFKYERTISYRIFGLGVCNVEGKENKWYITIFKTMIESIGFIILAFLMYLFEPFNGVYDAMFLPIYSSLDISFGAILLIISLLGLLINCFGLFTNRRQTLINIIFKDNVKDINYIDVDVEEKTLGRSY